ncbi:LPS export ABC transporter periplasmic protein LptC [Rhizobium sp. TRM95111]|uniref:LPS export ABC transporter periplasmic protein LptC n=1 Tax=Rhizobium alarense TaxID=2846851 RepID=UPI001F299FA3|nr:LPS export ABC transporter periplasmic protein LptC [Rhizobium alarense]MCF3639213.1 LPS export ABC transporter periplasmic protein LptC [Rhizobium alarense]
MLNTVTNSGMSMPPVASAAAYRMAMRHSRRVRLLKLLLPVAATVIAAIFVAVSVVRTYLPDDIEIAGATIENGKIVMQNPAISGRNQQDISYSMKADRALQDIRNPNVITLENIRAQMPVNESIVAQVDASTGVYDRGKNVLDMIAPFSIKLNTGLQASFQDAHLDINGGSMSTSHPVSIQSKEASIVAQSLRMTDKGRIVTFEGTVTVNIDPSAIRNSKQ